MRNLLLLATPLCASLAWSQGSLMFYNPGAPTRVGSPGGPIAGPGFWGQALVGTNASNLVPLGFPREHNSFGILPGQTTFVSFAAPGTYVQVQMAAWDGTLWGSDFASVPREQFGFTDIVPVWLVDPLHPVPDYPRFAAPHYGVLSNGSLSTKIIP